MATGKNAWTDFQRTLQCRQSANVEKMRKFHELLVQMSENAQGQGSSTPTRKHPALLERLWESPVLRQFRSGKRA